MCSISCLQIPLPWSRNGLCKARLPTHCPLLLRRATPGQFPEDTVPWLAFWQHPAPSSSLIQYRASLGLELVTAAPRQAHIISCELDACAGSTQRRKLKFRLHPQSCAPSSRLHPAVNTFSCLLTYSNSPPLDGGRGSIRLLGVLWGFGMVMDVQVYFTDIRDDSRLLRVLCFFSEIH